VSFSVDTENINFIIQSHCTPVQVEGTSYVNEYANIFLNLPNSAFRTVQWVGLCG